MRGAEAVHVWWEARKGEGNAAKHGISFDDAATVFLDPEAFDGPDLQHSSAESRCLRLRRSAGGHVLMIADTFRRSGDGGSDPDHQRTACEPTRACGVHGARLTFVTFPIHRRHISSERKHAGAGGVPDPHQRRSGPARSQGRCVAARSARADRGSVRRSQRTGMAASKRHSAM